MRSRTRSIVIVLGLMLAAICLGFVWSLFTTMVYEHDTWSFDVMFSEENMKRTGALLGVGVVVAIFWQVGKK